MVLRPPHAEVAWCVDEAGRALESLRQALLFEVLDKAEFEGAAEDAGAAF